MKYKNLGIENYRNNKFSVIMLIKKGKVANAWYDCIYGGGAPGRALFKGKENGFTLAEVLITLGVIGLVAALTLPSLIRNQRNKYLETALKRNYSTISQALNMYYANNGERLTSNTLGAHQLKPILEEYMNIVEDCEWGNCVSSTSNVYKNLNGTTPISLNFFDDGQFVLNDGSTILIENNGSGGLYRLYISVDVNGHKKNPNRLGWDLFMFQIDKNGSLLPMGAMGTAYYSANGETCLPTSTEPMSGAGCAVKAITEKDYFTKLR